MLKVLLQTEKRYFIFILKVFNVFTNFTDRCKR